MKIDKKILTIVKGFLVILFYYIYYNIFLLLFDAIGINVMDMNPTINIITFLGLDIQLILILWFIYRKDLKKEFIVFKNDFKYFVKTYIKYWYIGLILMSITNMLINLITKNPIAGNEEVVRSMLEKFPIYGIFSACISAPFVEEIVFRKTFKDVITNKYALMITCGLAFGLIHVMGTYESILDLLYIIPYGVFGYIFAFMYYKTQTIFVPMFMHFLHNSLLIIFFVIMNFVL